MNSGLKERSLLDETHAYKTINIPLEASLSQQDKVALDQVMEQYASKDLTYEVEGLNLLIKLRRINLDKLQLQINEIAHKDSVLHQVLSEIKKIKSYGVQGSQQVYAGFDGERKVTNRHEKEKSRGKAYYARGQTFSTHNNTVPDHFIDQVVCADSEQFLKTLPDNSIDLILTSPPYNFGLEYSEHEDSVDWEKYFDKLYGIFRECIRVTKFGGRIVINVQPLFSDYIPIHHFISHFFTREKLIWKAEIIWEKHNYNCKYTAWGSWKSPSNPYFKYTWEFLEVFCKGEMKKRGDKNKIDLTAEEFKQWVYGKWSIAPEKNMKDYGHPSMFPEELARRVLKMFSYQGDVILDPFMGTGTTAVVAKKTSRHFLGVEISEKYCQIAKDRLEAVSTENHKT